MPNSADQHHLQHTGARFEVWFWMALACAALVMILTGMINPNPPTELPTLLQPWRP